jgi:hypothetical protein
LIRRTCTLDSLSARTNQDPKKRSDPRPSASIGEIRALILPV